MTVGLLEGKLILPVKKKIGSENGSVFFVITGLEFGSENKKNFSQKEYIYSTKAQAHRPTTRARPCSVDGGARVW